MFAQDSVFMQLFCSLPTCVDRPSTTPSRWSRGGGIEQPCTYEVQCGSLLLEWLSNRLEEINANYMVSLNSNIVMSH